MHNPVSAIIVNLSNWARISHFSIQWPLINKYQFIVVKYVYISLTWQNKWGSHIENIAQHQINIVNACYDVQMHVSNYWNNFWKECCYKYECKWCQILCCHVCSMFEVCTNDKCWNLELVPIWNCSHGVTVCSWIICREISRCLRRCTRTVSTVAVYTSCKTVYM